MQLIKIPVLKRFLFAFFFYNMGVQTVMLAAANFGTKILNLPSTNLIITMVLIQLVAIAGAYLMSKLSSIYGQSAGSYRRGHFLGVYLCGGLLYAN